MVTEIWYANLLPCGVGEVMNPFVLRVVFHVMFEHPGLPREHLKNTHFTQPRIVVNCGTLSGSGTWEERVGKYASSPSAALEISQSEASDDPIVMPFIASQRPNLRLSIPAELSTRKKLGGVGPQLLSGCQQ